MRAIAIVAGALLLLTGAVWTGQGAGLIRGSFMTGSVTWLIIGLVCVAAGVALVAGAARYRRSG